MRIVQLTPGTGNFHCGSCLRDIALVRELRQRGHDVLMVPMYLPFVEDDAERVETAPLMFGGINVYLSQKLPMFRKMPAWVGRMLSAPALLRACARFSNMTTARDHGELSLSMLRGEAGFQSAEIEKLIAWLKTQPAPDVFCLSNSLLAGLTRRLKQEFNVPVVCTWQGEDSFLDSLPEPYRTEAWSELARRSVDVDQFIAVSRFFAGVMNAKVKLPAEKITVIYNGINFAGYELGQMPATPTIGYLARMHHGKGLTTLVDAFVELKKRPRWQGARLLIAGTTTPADEPYLRQLRQKIAEAGIEDAVEWHPNLEHQAKLDFLRSLSVFSVPATYGEAFGLFVIEALACGVPVVQPQHGAFPEILDKTGGGLLCEPHDPVALANALEQALSDPQAACKMGEQGRENVLKHFSVARMADEVEDVLQKVIKQHGARV
jgi:glycosyltransferase involved in cell wall biosynthesis